MKASRFRTEFGDFQTPSELAVKVCALLSESGISPASILEPTCGQGNFLTAAAKTFNGAQKMIGVEINADYSRHAKQALDRQQTCIAFEIITADFFSFQWKSLIRDLRRPLLILGNPPWVTNAELATLRSANIPDKSNFQNHRGIDAITGKANFDISEYMLLCALHWLDKNEGVLAVLCKTAVARKVLRQAWRNQLTIRKADVYSIDAKRYFGAAVDACLLVMEFSPESRSHECGYHPDLVPAASSTFGIRGDRLVADISKYERWRHLHKSKRGRWRSGIKHDCSKVMQLVRQGPKYRNGFGELVELEEAFVYPMLKSSDLANKKTPDPRRYMLVPQQYVGEPTEKIRDQAPKTWEYLNRHAEQLDRRSSSIYKKRPRFSIFGVGEYSFVPWKVGISGLYKQLTFRLIGPFEERPIVLDDTCYCYPCENEKHARILTELLNSPVAREFLSSLIFWDDKRPVTADVLDQLDVLELARECRRFDEYNESISDVRSAQRLLF